MIKEKIANLSIFITVCIFVGCASFGSVKTMANLGKEIDSFKQSLDPIPQACRLANFKKIDETDDCSIIDEDLKEWSKMNHILVAYAKTLLALADNATDKSFKDDISTALGSISKIESLKSINSNIASGVASGADALVRTITSSYRRSALKKTIQDNNTHVQNIAGGFNTFCDFIDKAEDNKRKILMETRQIILSTITPQGQADLAGIDSALAILDHSKTQRISYKKAVLAFARAHNMLSSDFDKTNDAAGDLELTQALTKDIAQFLSGLSKATTPAQ